jgi:hypothetical protein
MGAQPCETPSAMITQNRAMPAGGVFSEPAQAEYRALRDAHPGDPLHETLYARSLIGARTPEAIGILEGVIARDPAYPHARLRLAQIYSSPAFQNPVKLRENLEAYEKACAASLAAFPYAVRSGDADFVKHQAAVLRQRIDGRTDAQAIGVFPILWTLELKAVPPSGQDTVRDRIRQDVERLRPLDWTENPNLLSALRQGYQMLGDAAGSRWVEEHTPANPNPAVAASEAIVKWRQANQPKPPADNQEYCRKTAQQADLWIRQWPDDPAPYYEEFRALEGQRDAAQEDVVKAAEELLRAYEKHSNHSGTYIVVADFYASRNVHNDKLASLVEKGLRDFREPIPISDLGAHLGSVRIASPASKYYIWPTAASIYVKVRQYDKARDLLAQLGKSLEEGRLPAGASDMEKEEYAACERAYRDALAKLAEAERH